MVRSHENDWPFAKHPGGEIFGDGKTGSKGRVGIGFLVPCPRPDEKREGEVDRGVVGQ